MSRIEFLETPIKTEINDSNALIIAQDTDYDDVLWVLSQHHIVETKGVQDDYELAEETTITNTESLFRAMIANAEEETLSQMLGSLGYKQLWRLITALSERYNATRMIIKVAGTDKVLREIVNSNGIEEMAAYFRSNPNTWAQLLREYAQKQAKEEASK